MHENIKKNKYWIIPSVIAVVLALGGASLSVVRNDAKLEERTKGIEINRVDIQRVEDQKADKEVIKQINVTLVRIEGKLDQYILQDKN